MTMTDFSRPQRMGIGALFIIFTKKFLSLLVPLATVTFIKLLDTSSLKDFGVLQFLLTSCGVLICLPLVMALIAYLPTKFYIKDGNLIFIHGLIKREDTFVPLDRVHSLRTKKGIWYRLLDLRGIVFDTLATRQEEIELILSESEWQRLLSVIEKEEQPDVPASAEAATQGQATIVRYPTKNLLLAALCQNHLKGMAVLGSIFGVILGNLDELSDKATESIAGYLDAYTESLLASPLRLTVFLVVIYTVTLMLWLGRVLLRYYDMTMRHERNVLTFTYGMFTRASCRFFRDKICTIRVKRNFLEKRFGFCTLMLRQALNASAAKEEDNMKLYGSDSSTFFLDWWLGEGYIASPEIITAGSGRGVFFHSVAARFVLAIAAVIVLSHFRLFGWLVIPLLYVVVLYFRGIYSMRHSRIELRESYFIIHTGAFAEITNFIEYPDVEVVRIRRTPLTKLFHRVSLVLSTSGTTFEVRSLKEDEAEIIYELLLQKAEGVPMTHRP